MAENSIGKLSSKSGLGAALGGDTFDVWKAVGGVRGVVETIVPTLIFVIAFAITHEVPLPALIAMAFSVLAVIVRIIQRIEVMPALGGLVGVGLSAAVAWWTNSASNYFAIGLVSGIAYFLLLAISQLVRWPILGLLIGYGRNEGLRWREDRALYRRYAQINLLWIGVYAIRLIVRVPLYFMDKAVALGSSAIILGPGLFALAAWFTWMLIRSAPKLAASPEPEPHPDTHEPQPQQ